MLEVRSPTEYEEVRMPGANLIPPGALRPRLEEVPQDRRVVAFCKTSLCAYEASIILRYNGYGNVWVLDGGMGRLALRKANEQEIASYH